MIGFEVGLWLEPRRTAAFGKFCKRRETAHPDETLERLEPNEIAKTGARKSELIDPAD